MSLLRYLKQQEELRATIAKTRNRRVAIPDIPPLEERLKGTIRLEAVTYNNAEGGCLTLGMGGDTRSLKEAITYLYQDITHTTLSGHGVTPFRGTIDGTSLSIRPFAFNHACQLIQALYDALPDRFEPAALKACKEAGLMAEKRSLHRP